MGKKMNFQSVAEEFLNKGVDVEAGRDREVAISSDWDEDKGIGGTGDDDGVSGVDVRDVGVGGDGDGRDDGVAGGAEVSDWLGMLGKDLGDVMSSGDLERFLGWCERVLGVGVLPSYDKFREAVIRHYRLGLRGVRDGRLADMVWNYRSLEDFRRDWGVLDEYFSFKRDVIGERWIGYPLTKEAAIYLSHGGRVPLRWDKDGWVGYVLRGDDARWVVEGVVDFSEGEYLKEGGGWQDLSKVGSGLRKVIWAKAYEWMKGGLGGKALVKSWSVGDHEYVRYGVTFFYLYVLWEDLGRWVWEKGYHVDENGIYLVEVVRVGGQDRFLVGKFARGLDMGKARNRDFEVLFRDRVSGSGAFYWGFSGGDVELARDMDSARVLASLRFFRDRSKDGKAGALGRLIEENDVVGAYRMKFMGRDAVLLVDKAKGVDYLIDYRRNWVFMDGVELSIAKFFDVGEKAIFAAADLPAFQKFMHEALLNRFEYYLNYETLQVLEREHFPLIFLFMIEPYKSVDWRHMMPHSRVMRTRTLMLSSFKKSCVSCVCDLGGRWLGVFAWYSGDEILSKIDFATTHQEILRYFNVKILPFMRRSGKFRIYENPIEVKNLLDAALKSVRPAVPLKDVIRDMIRYHPRGLTKVSKTIFSEKFFRIFGHGFLRAVARTVYFNFYDEQRKAVMYLFAKIIGERYVRKGEEIANLLKRSGAMIGMEYYGEFELEKLFLEGESSFVRSEELRRFRIYFANGLPKDRALSSYTVLVWGEVVSASVPSLEKKDRFSPSDIWLRLENRFGLKDEPTGKFISFPFRVLKEVIRLDVFMDMFRRHEFKVLKSGGGV